jgi:hypothetical protein
MALMDGVDGAVEVGSTGTMVSVETGSVVLVASTMVALMVILTG